MPHMPQGCKTDGKLFDIVLGRANQSAVTAGSVQLK